MDEPTLAELDVPMITIADRGDEGIEIDPGEGLSRYEVLGLLMHAAMLELAEQLAESLGLQLPTNDG